VLWLPQNRSGNAPIENLQHDRHRNRMYWLALDNSPPSLPLKLSAAIAKPNIIKITAKDNNGKVATGIELRVYLSKELVNFSKEVTIKVNGEVKFKGIVKPTMEALISSTAERGDPKQVFPAQVKLEFQINLTYLI